MSIYSRNLSKNSFVKKEGQKADISASQPKQSVSKRCIPEIDIKTAIVLIEIADDKLFNITPQYVFHSLLVEDITIKVSIERILMGVFPHDETLSREIKVEAKRNELKEKINSSRGYYNASTIVSPRKITTTKSTSTQSTGTQTIPLRVPQSSVSTQTDESGLQPLLSNKLVDPPDNLIMIPSDDFSLQSSKSNDKIVDTVASDKDYTVSDNLSISSDDNDCQIRKISPQHYRATTRTRIPKVTEDLLFESERYDCDSYPLASAHSKIKHHNKLECKNQFYTLPKHPTDNTPLSNEIFWELEFNDLNRIYDSEPFIFAGYRWKITFGRYNELGFGLMIGLAQKVTAKIFCEFKLHCQLKPVYSKKSKGNYYFSPTTSKYRGFKHFIGTELMSYIDDGKLTISVVLSSEVGLNGELLGVTGLQDVSNDGMTIESDDDADDTRSVSSCESHISNLSNFSMNSSNGNGNGKKMKFIRGKKDKYNF